MRTGILIGYKKNKSGEIILGTEVNYLDVRKKFKELKSDDCGEFERVVLYSEPEMIAGAKALRKTSGAEREKLAQAEADLKSAEKEAAAKKVADKEAAEKEAAEKKKSKKGK